MIKRRSSVGVLLLLLIAFSASAQIDYERAIGIKIQPQWASLTPKFEYAKSRITMGGGISFNRKVLTNFALQSGLFYSDKGYRVEHIQFNLSGYGDLETLSSYSHYKYSFITLPLLLKFKLANFYCSAGPTMNYLLKFQIKYEDTEIQSTTIFEEPITYGGQLALGYEKRILENFLISIEANFEPTIAPEPFSSTKFLNYGFGLGISYLLKEENQPNL